MSSKAIILVVTLLFLLATLVRAGPLYSHRRPKLSHRVGEPCQTWITCNDSILWSHEEKPCDNRTCEGPNVCESTSTYIDFYESGVYACHGKGKYCISLECVPTGVCNITVNDTYTDYQCCHGYSEDYRRSEDYHKFYYPLPGFHDIQKNGCPRELNESVCDCLEDLKLTQFKSLIEATGLDATLCTPNQTKEYTIFAPTNEAITKAGISKLSKQEQIRIVRSHILPVKVDSWELSGIFAHESLAPGHRIHVDNSYSWASRYNLVNGERLLIEDGCKSMDGIVHVVDGVINTTNQTIAQILQRTPHFSTLWSLLVRANLTHTLNQSYDLFHTTFFAPDNTAFQKGSKELGIDIATCLRAGSNATLSYILNYHHVPELVYSKVISQYTSLSTEACIYPPGMVYGDDFGMFFDCFLDIKSTDEGISVGKTGSVITTPDISGSNGVIHAVSLPLIPSSVDLKQMCSKVKLN